MRSVRKTLLTGGLTGLALFSAHAAVADEKGEKLLSEAFRTLQQARSLTADLETQTETTGNPLVTGKGTISLKKPNLLSVLVSVPTGAGVRKTASISDGKSYFNYREGAPTYMRESVSPTPVQFNGDWEGEVDAFFGGEKIASDLKVDFAGSDTLDGTLCDLIHVNKTGDDRAFTYTIGHKDHLIYSTSWTAKLDEKTTMTETHRLRNIKLNAPVASSLFAFTPPAGVKLYDPAEEIRQLEAKLVAVGEEAPAFELTAPQDKNRFSLAQAMNGRKAVLVNFWFYG